MCSVGSSHSCTVYLLSQELTKKSPFLHPQSHHVNTKEFVERVKEVLQTSADGVVIENHASCLRGEPIPRPS